MIFHFKMSTHNKLIFNRLNFINFSLFLKKDLFVCFLAAVGLCCCMWAFSSCSDRELFFIAVLGFLIAVASLLQSPGSRHPGSSSCSTGAQAVVAPRLSCSMA